MKDITILSRKINPDYELDSSKNIMLDPEVYPDIVAKLNSIIEWDEVKFPLDVKSAHVVTDKLTDEINNLLTVGNIPEENLLDILNQVSGLDFNNLRKESDGEWYADRIEADQKRNFLGNPPSLKPGDTFNWQDKHVFCVCNLEGKETLGLINTTTGPKVLERFAKEYILPQFKTSDNYFSEIDINVITVDYINREDLLIFSDPEEESFEDVLGLEGYMYTGRKLEFGEFRKFLIDFPIAYKEVVNEHKILQITCQPMGEETELWIDDNGIVVFNTGEFDGCEDIVIPELIPALTNFFRNVKE